MKQMTLEEFRDTFDCYVSVDSNGDVSASDKEPEMDITDGNITWYWSRDERVLFNYITDFITKESILAHDPRVLLKPEVKPEGEKDGRRE